MAYILDTNVAIHLRDGDATTAARVAALADAVLISIGGSNSMAVCIVTQPTRPHAAHALMSC